MIGPAAPSLRGDGAPGSMGKATVDEPPRLARLCGGAAGVVGRRFVIGVDVEAPSAGPLGGGFASVGFVFRVQLFVASMCDTLPDVFSR